MNKNDLQFKSREEVRKTMEEVLLENPNPTTLDIEAEVYYAPGVKISNVVIPATQDEGLVLEGLQALIDAADIVQNPDIRELPLSEVEKFYQGDLKRLAYLYCRQIPSDEMYLQIANENDNGEITEGYSEIVDTENEHVAEFLNLDALYRQYGICVQSALAVAKMLQAARVPKSSKPEGPTGMGE